MNKTINFLFGSGVSLSTNIPNTDELTKTLLKDKNIRMYTDNSFYLSSREDNVMHSELVVDFIQKFLVRLNTRIRNYYKWIGKTNLGYKRMLNYESLYYLVWQLWSGGSGEYDNPIVLNTYKELDKRFVSQISAIKERCFYNKNFIGFLDAILIYIEDVICEKLYKNLSGEFIKLVHEACNNPVIKKINIFTLNHDTLVEQFLEREGINYCDGFIKNELPILLWNPEIFKEDGFKIDLYKLHGSINWYQFKKENDSNYFVGKAPHGFIELDHVEYSKNKYLYRYNRHMILIGTFNKMFDYLTNIFIEIHYKFFNILYNIDTLIISGYSFNDKGINFSIKKWLDSDTVKKIILINPDPEELRFNSRGMIKNSWYYWKKNKKLLIIPKKFEETSWDDLKQFLEEI